jgi:hypothetical protein
MRHTNFNQEIDAHEGNDWLGMFFATIAALVVAGMVIALVDKVTGLELHNWIADAFISLVETA